MKYSHVLSALAAASLSTVTNAQSSCGPAPSGGIRPSIASGYRLQVVATGLARPRGLALDNAGNLLVVQAGNGAISALTLNDQNGCVSVSNTRDVTQNIGLTHSLALSGDGRTLYASTTEEVFQWAYDGQGASATNQQTIINGMGPGRDHGTRTLLLSQQVPGMITVARGSMINIDMEAASEDTGVSQVRAFNLNERGGQAYNYPTDGTRLGWGLRNEVGIGEHPNGGIWGVENSADGQTRMGVDIHENNPAEELNFFGYLNGTEYANQGGNFGYPWCFSAWDVASLPSNANLRVGSQYAIDAVEASNNQNRTDEYCAQQVQSRLVFQAHMAPLDIKFNNTGSEAWVTFRGSWNRDTPTGYKLSMVQFGADGQPTAAQDSTTAAVDVISNEDITRCPDNCFRPVAMAVDPQGRIYMSSDASGEIYLVSRDATSTGTSSAAPSASASGSTTGNANAASSFNIPIVSQVGAALAALMMLF